jgi:transcriptional regulator with XRE-family HTH domain
LDGIGPLKVGNPIKVGNPLKASTTKAGNALKPSHIGEYIREQRQSAQFSVRQLATLAGVSNPYLSQIERGLRKPSAEILQQIAKALRISAEALYVEAGFLQERGLSGDASEGILADPHITERQKAVLLEIYASFRRENLTQPHSQEEPDGHDPHTATDNPEGRDHQAGSSPDARSTEDHGAEDRSAEAGSS